jgi:hypothetical protein
MPHQVSSFLLIKELLCFELLKITVEASQNSFQDLKAVVAHD